MVIQLSWHHLLKTVLHCIVENQLTINISKGLFKFYAIGLYFHPYASITVLITVVLQQVLQLGRVHSSTLLFFKLF